MIIKETVTISGRQFYHRYSDENRYLVRDEQEYTEAYDPIEFDREYVEGREIETEPEPEE